MTTLSIALGVVFIMCIVAFAQIDEMKKITAEDLDKKTKDLYQRIYELQNQLDLFEMEAIPAHVRKERYKHMEKFGLNPEFDRFIFVLKRVRLAFDDSYGFEHFSSLRDIAQKIVKEHVSKNDKDFETFVNGGAVEKYIQTNYPKYYRHNI